MKANFRLVAIALFAAIGCGGSAGDAVQVTGTVKHADGSDISFEAGTIVFQAADPTQFASGRVEPDGAFALMTKKPGDGVKPGQYKVVLQLWKNYRDRSLAVPAQYGDAATTPLEATVDADHTEFEFKVEN